MLRRYLYLADTYSITALPKQKALKNTYFLSLSRTQSISSLTGDQALLLLLVVERLQGLHVCVPVAHEHPAGVEGGEEAQTRNEVCTVCVGWTTA